MKYVKLFEGFLNESLGSKLSQALDAAKITNKFVPSTDPQVEDDSVNLPGFQGKEGVHIQIADYDAKPYCISYMSDEKGVLYSLAELKTPEEVIKYLQTVNIDDEVDRINKLK